MFETELEGGERVVHLSELDGLWDEEVAVHVPAAPVDKEGLAAEAQSGADFNGAEDGAESVGEVISVREKRGDGT